MKIEKITFEKKGVTIYDELNSYFIHRDVVLKYQLETGLEIDLEDLERESEKIFCYERASWYLAGRIRSSYEIMEYLKKKDFSKEAARYAVDRLMREGYLDDEEYAKIFIREKGRKYGSYYLIAKLREKQIPQEIISSLDLKEDPEKMAEILKNKYGSVTFDYKTKGKMLRFLQSRGFSSENIYKAVDFFENM